MKKGIIGWTENITSTRLPQCYRCVHHFGKRRCKAFPEKDIPREYMTEKVKHEIILGNQEGDFVYLVKEKFEKEDEKFELIGQQAISELEANKNELPIVIRERIKEFGGDLNSIEKLEIKSSGPLRNRFDFQIQFFPENELVKIDIMNFNKGGKIASKIIRALEAKKLEPRFQLTIFKNGDYKYE